MPSSFIDMGSLNYCGSEAQQIFSKDIYDIDLRSYGVTFMDGVKGKTKIYSGEMGDLWQKYTCAFSPEGNVSLAESYVEPVAIKINLEECYDVFWPTYLVDQTSISLNGGVPQTFADWFFARFRQKALKEYQQIAWAGDTGYTGSTQAYLKVADGWLKQLESATGATKITGASVTVDNVIAQIEAAINKAIEVANGQGVDFENYKVFLNHGDYKMLEVALGKECCPNSTNAVFANYSRGGNGHIYVMGFEAVPTMQPKNTVVVGPASNLVLAFDTYDANVAYQMIDMRGTTGDNSFRILALTNIGMGIVFPELFVYSRVTD